MDADKLKAAFNKGSDARLAGIPELWNCYDEEDNPEEAKYWRYGWRHVNDMWGHNAYKGFKLLRPVHYRDREYARLPHRTLEGTSSARDTRARDAVAAAVLLTQLRGHNAAA